MTPVAEALSEAAATLRRSTVRILNGRASIGSGVIWRDDGLIITNAHVIRGSRVVVEDSADRRFEARVEARSATRDLAALRIAATGLPVLPKLQSNCLRVGDLVMALGNPLGVPGAVVTGIVHAVGPAEGLEHQPWIQADIRLAPGNSGGPLADARSRVAGINSMIARGLGLAVPSDSVEKFLRGETDQPTIGVAVHAVAVRGPKETRLGLYVEDVDRGSPAALGGIRMGDILIGHADRPFRKPADLLVVLRSGPPVVALDVLRDNRLISIEVPVQK